MTSPKHATSTNRGRLYTNPITGEQVPSVTTVLGQIGKAEALKWWAAGETAKYAVTMKDTWLNLEAQAAIDLLKREPLRVLNKAADRGTDVHAIADHYAQTGEIGEIGHHSGYVDAMRAFFYDHQPLPILAEQTVFGDGYAGSFDLICKLPALNDQICILDYKTSKAIYPDTAAQLAAYANAGRYIDSDDLMQDLPKIECGVIVRFGADGEYEIQQADLDAGWQYFQAALAVHKAQQMKLLTGRVLAKHEHDNTAMRANIVERVTYLQTNHPESMDMLRMNWIHGLPPLSSPTPINRHQLAILHKIVSKVEATTSAPFNPPPQPTPPPIFQKPPKAQTHVGDEIPCDPAQIEQIRQAMKQSKPEIREAIQITAQEANKAKMTLSLNGKPTLRRAAIAQMMLDIYTADCTNNREYLRTILQHLNLYQNDIGTTLGALDLDKISAIAETHGYIEQGDLQVVYNTETDTFSVTTKGKQK